MIEQTIIAICGMSSIWLANDPRQDWRRWACIIGMAAQPAWAYSSWQAEQWGIFCLTFVYAGAGRAGSGIHG